MTIANRLKEIEHFWENDTSIIAMRESAICYAKYDIDYLMTQVKRLTEALSDIYAHPDCTGTEIGCFVFDKIRALVTEE